MLKKFLLHFLLGTACSVNGFAQPAGIQQPTDKEEEWEDPSCVFSGMMWDGSSIEDLGYFTEGNKKGEYIKIFLPNGGRSRKYAYYGDSPIAFYRELEVKDEKDESKPGKPLPAKKDEEPEKKKEKKFEYVPVIAANYKSSWKEAFFFFATECPKRCKETPCPHPPLWYAKELDFSLDSFPAGKFWFISSCKDQVFLKFGAHGEKALLKGGEIKLDAKIDEVGDLTILVFQQKFGLKRKVYSTIWNLNPRTRTLVFLQPRPNGVKVRRISDLVLDEQALGLRPPKDDKKKTKPPSGGPGK